MKPDADWRRFTGKWRVVDFSMNAIGLLFFIANAVALLCLPRKWAAVPLILGCCYMTIGQSYEVAGISLPMIRLLLMAGFLRIMVRGEGVAGGINIVDKLMLMLGGWLFFANLFHNGEGSGPIYITGKIAEIGLCYLLIRTFCRDIDELASLIAIIAVLLLPVALEMIQEKITGRNLFSAALGGEDVATVMRDGRLRARGPFRHAILAGTVGAACFPLMLGIWGRNRRVAMIGIFSCLAMVATCASSGPVLSLIFALGAVFLWQFRRFMGMLRWGMVGGYLLLELTMSRPAYYIIGEMSVVGGSTGWHRSHLIHSSIKYFSEWWLFGTDRTRHWMPTGVNWSKNHTDITNYFIAFGVMGGFLAMVLMIAVIWVCFKWVGNIIDVQKLSGSPYQFLIWCMGASLFSHVGTSISVAYYDQSYVFFWFSIATISSMHVLLFQQTEEEQEDEESTESSPPEVATSTNY